MAKVEWRTEGAYILLRVPYNEDFLMDLKSSIPYRHRSWMPKPAACWRVSRLYKEDIRRLVLGYFDVALDEPQPSKNEREGNTTGDAFSDGGERVRTADGIEALRLQLQAANSRNAQLDLQVRFLRQNVATLESQLAMARTGQWGGTTSSDDFSIRSFLRQFGAKGYRSLIRTCHPDVAEDKAAAEAFTKKLTTLAADMGVS